MPILCQLAFQPWQTEMQISSFSNFIKINIESKDLLKSRANKVNKKMLSNNCICE